MKIYCTILFLTSMVLNTYSAVFYVTSKNDSGIGTLRQAILDANANGVSSTDHVYFNLPGGTVSDVTISLTDELPSLTSNMVIDGTSQSTSLLGNISIRVVLTRVSARYINGLKLSNVEDIKIFGIYFRNFVSPNGIPADDRTAAIYLENSRSIVIGEPGKGNCFGNNYTSIISPTYQHVLDNIKISSNIIGLSPSGITAEPNYVGIDLSYLSNSVIGGSHPEEGNVISSNDSGVSLGAMLNKVDFSNNIIGADNTKGRIFNGAAGAIALFANGEFADITISYNYILAHEIGIKLDNLRNNYTLSNNVVGGSLAGKNRKYGIELYNCLAGNISDNNKISYNTIGIYINRSYPVSILRNSFNCNEKAIEFVNPPIGKSVTTSRISNIAATQINGIYLPNSKIELFYTDACVDCEGKEWIATILTDGSGNWSYNGTIDLTRSITSTGTNQDGATATFSKPLMDQNNAVKTDVICNQPTGSIRGIVTYDASIFEWRDANGVIVGNNRDLENVGPGSYRLTARQNNLCSVTSQTFVITSSGTGISETNRQISNAYCGQSNGAVRGIVTPNNVPRIWYNSANAEVSRSDDLVNVTAGIYYFKAQLGTCEITSPNYTVANVEFNYSVAIEQVNLATCAQNNGSITVTSFKGNEPDNVKWFNANGLEVGSSRVLTGLSVGTYRLIGYSNFGCSYLIKEYTITEVPKPNISLQNLKQYINCDGKSVTTSGIEVVGQTAPYSFSWLDQNSTLVSTTLNLRNAPVGKYILNIIDRNGCAVQSEEIDFTQLEETVLKIPNTFTPNGDSVNDLWEIKGMENYPDAEFNIFNRNGNVVFKSKGYSKPFDGAHNGKQLPVGVYFYKINLNTECGVLTGSLTIIR